jgi:hypothetical protein
MNWEAVVAIGETLGSVAVLITLVYLSYQIRHARSELRYSVAQNRFDTYRGLTMETVRNFDIARIMSAVEEAWTPEMATIEELEEAANLNPVEKKQFRDYQRAWFMYRVQTIAHIDQLSPSQRTLFDNATGLFYASGVGGLWFKWLKENNPAIDEGAWPYIQRLIEAKGGS